MYTYCTKLISSLKKGDEMGIFKEEPETKRMIFNIRGDLTDRLLLAKEDARSMGKRLDIDTAINKAIEKFLQKAEKRIKEEKKKHGNFLHSLKEKTAHGALSDSKDIVEPAITEEDHQKQKNNQLQKGA